VGSHLPGKTAEDVEVIRFHNGKMRHIPDKIGHFFKNLKYFLVRSKLNLKILRRSNFENLLNLVDLEIGSNNIDTLNKDTLWDLPNLERFSFYDNELKMLHESTFENNLKLREVYLRSNNLEFLPRYLFKNNLFLQSVNFDNNLLSIVETSFSNIKSISLLHNVCINALYDGKHCFESHNLKNITEFQNFLSLKCSSKKL